MKTFYIDRYESTSGGTRSVIFNHAGLKLYGIERPWSDNKPFESCIPSGVYMALPHKSPKFGNCVILVGGTVSADLQPESERYSCLMHVANWADQVQGCVGVGTGQGIGNRKPMVTSSRDGMAELLEFLTEPMQVLISWRLPEKTRND